MNFFTDLAAVQAATAAGQAARICAELVYGFAAQPTVIEAFAKLRAQVDTGLAGSRLAKDRAADALAQVMIPGPRLPGVSRSADASVSQGGAPRAPPFRSSSVDPEARPACRCAYAPHGFPV